jgi:hypothetical protein
MQAMRQALRKSLVRSCRYPIALLMCAAVVPGSATAVVADDEPAQISAATRANEEVEVLLKRIEEQIVAGRTFSPRNDNAVVTWTRAMRRINLAAPATERLLNTFIDGLRRRAREEQASEHTVIAVDLGLFADQASDLLARRATMETSRTEPAQQQLTQTATPVPSNDAAEPGRVQAANRAPNPGRSDAPAPDGAHTATVEATRAPLPNDGRRAATLAPPHTSFVPKPPPTGGPVAEGPAAEGPAASFMRRGDEMLVLKDVSAARKFYQYAAGTGSSRAADALARTYDPSFASALGVPVSMLDRDEAAHWYAMAASLGLEDATIRLRSVTAQVGR